MKKVLLFLPMLLLFSFSAVEDPLTAQEKEYASNFLKEAQQGVFDAVKDLTEAQLKFKPGPDKWSIEECVKHIAASENNLWTMVEASLKKPANPDKRSEIKLKDEELVKQVTDRTNKAKTFEALKPENTTFASTSAALDAFLQDRENLIAYVKNSKDDMRNHVSTLPMGSYDAYQLILLIGAHTTRHVKQIEELKADAGFPKS